MAKPFGMSDAEWVAYRERVKRRNADPGYAYRVALRTYPRRPSFGTGHLTGIEEGPASLICSVILGTVNRPELLKECVEAIRKGVVDLSYEIVIAYGTEEEVSLPWMKSQPDVRPVLGGMEGAIPAFNTAYRASHGKYICQINDDVLVNPYSIKTAVDYLDKNLNTAGVVFKFNRQDGKGYVNQHLRGGLHPNQMIVRREVCEAVSERIGGFWGDEEHRSDKTYGGDSSFGAMCIHLGLLLVTLEGVTCIDDMRRTANDALRQRNTHAKIGVKNWWEMYAPFMATPASEPTVEEWPNIYVPRPGFPARRSPIQAGPAERVLHLSLSREEGDQYGLEVALTKLGPYLRIPWAREIKQGVSHLENKILNEIRQFRPTLIFCQIQSEGWPSVEFLHAMKKEAPSECVLLNWTGDVRTSPQQPCERWQVKMCQGVDLFLASNCTYPVKLKVEEKVPCATGYVLCGTQPQENPWVQNPDEVLWKAAKGKAVFVGNRHNWSKQRDQIFLAVNKEMPGKLVFYGREWKGRNSFGPIPRIHRASVHAVANVVLGSSAFNDLRRYTSGRMTDALHTGAVYAMQAFNDWEGLGVKDGKHVLVWRDQKDLKELLEDWLRPEREPDRAQVRQAAHEIAVRDFTWESVMENFLAIVRNLRGRREK